MQLRINVTQLRDINFFIIKVATEFFRGSMAAAYIYFAAKLIKLFGVR